MDENLYLEGEFSLDSIAPNQAPAPSQLTSALPYAGSDDDLEGLDDFSDDD